MLALLCAERGPGKAGGTCAGSFPGELDRDRGEGAAAVGLE